jgi:hypothetical protein
MQHTRIIQWLTRMQSQAMVVSESVWKAQMCSKCAKNGQDSYLSWAPLLFITFQTKLAIMGKLSPFCALANSPHPRSRMDQHFGKSPYMQHVPWTWCMYSTTQTWVMEFSRIYVCHICLAWSKRETLLDFHHGFQYRSHSTEYLWNLGGYEWNEDTTMHPRSRFHYPWGG